MRAVDVHTHFLPLSMRGELERRGVRVDGGRLALASGDTVPAAYPDLLTQQGKLKAMDRRGIAHSIVSITPHLFLYGAREQARFAELANDALAEFISGSSRLSGLATLPITDPRRAAKELARSVTELGLRGAQIGTSLPDGTPLDRAGLDPLWDTAQALGVPIALHPYYAGLLTDTDLFLNNTVGVPLDTCLAAARLMCSGLLDRWPDLRFVLPHGAGHLPFQLGRIDQAVKARPEALRAARRPSEYLESFFADTVVHSQPALRFLAEAFGLERLLLGTDLPYLTGVDRPVEQLTSAGLDIDALTRNAIQLFGLGDRGE